MAITPDLIEQRCPGFIAGLVTLLETRPTVISVHAPAVGFNPERVTPDGWRITRPGPMTIVIQVPTPDEGP